MSAGAFLALWNGVDDPAWMDEYEAWHAFEHVPERVGSPGFLAGARYAARPGTATGPAHPAYFTAYWLHDLAALRTPQYQTLLDQPSAWSRRLRPHLSDFRRRPCTVGGRHGQGLGSQLATLEWALPTPEAAPALDAALAAVVTGGQALAAHWGPVVADGGHPLAPTRPSAPHAPDAPDAPDTPEATGTPVVVLVEHTHARRLDQAVQHCLARLTALGPAPVRCACYTLQSQVLQTELTAPLAQRQPERPELSAPYLTRIPGDPA